MARHVRKGDTVEIIAGKYKGKQGKVVEIMTHNDRVRVEGVGAVKKHVKAGRDPKVPQGGITESFASIHISNVMPLDPQSKKPTRVGFKKLEDGRKVRVARRSGEVLADQTSA